MLSCARRLHGLRFAILIALLAALVPLVAQERTAYAPRSVTAADYARAEKFLAPNVSPLVIGGSVAATWLPDDRFWYRNTTSDGWEFVVVDAAKRTKAPGFDHVKLAATLSAAAGRSYDARHLPFEAFEISSDGASVSFAVDGHLWSCDVQGAKCVDRGPAPAASGDAAAIQGQGRRGRGAPTAMSSDNKPLAISPDGTRAVFIRNWNLWLRDMATGQERALTTDGVEYFGYATDNAGWSSSERAIVLWSPDSKKIATYQQDERKVGEMYLVRTPVSPVTHPTLRVSKFPLPGDPVMAMLHRVIVDADTGRVTRVQLEPDYHRATLGDDVSLDDLQWSPDAARLAFASVSRDHKQAWLRVADASTGAVRTVFDEKVATQYESRAGWRVLWATNEVIWYSERHNWGHLYLYDFLTGALKHQITTGEGPVMQIARVDETSRTIWFVAQGREKGEDPYFRHAYRIGLDGKNLVSLTPDEGDHAVQLAPSGRYLIDTYSRPDTPPVVGLRDANGQAVMALEKADISRLLAAGWKPPTRIRVKAHDGTTDLYGLMFTPTNLDPAKTYPIVNNVYPGPQTGSTGGRSFTAARGDRQALAELGFVVVTIDGMGTPGRSKAFQDAYYGAMGRDNTIPDQIAGMQDLARQYPFIDLDRAGIWGHSGGGFATTTAMFRFPDAFKAGIAESGNHDQRLNEDDWGERYQGLLVRTPDGRDNYEAEANQNYAKDLKGHLLLAHGTMDVNVPPYQTLLVADALIKANKDFDLLMLPNQDHGYGAASNYMMRRRWDYFVKWLLGAEPPKEYRIQPPAGGRPTTAGSVGSGRQPGSVGSGFSRIGSPALREPTRDDILRGGYGPYRANNDLLSYDLDVRVDPEKKSISGRNTIRFRMLQDGTRIQIDLFANLDVDKIVFAGAPRDAAARHVGPLHLKYQRELNSVFIDFPQPLRQGRVYAIDFYYSGQPAQTGRFGGITFGKDPAGRPWINTACQHTGSSVWWPSKDQYRDEVEDMRLSVEVPNDLVDVSNGKFVEKTNLGDGYTRWTWAIQYPINNYCVSLNIGRYDHFTDALGDMTLDFYVLPEDVEKAKKQFGQAKSMIEAFQKYFGEYAFKKDGYKLIQAPYSGMEHQSAVTYGNRFANGYLERDWTGVGISPRFDFIIIHESAHEWFGNAVTAADVCDEWIHEAWGTYAEAVYVEHMWGKADALTYLNGYKSKVRNVDAIVPACGINRVPPQDMYFKGALFLNTLRSIVDDDARWWKMVRGFYARFKYRDITTADVVAYFNRAMGGTVAPVFDQYLRHTALPTLELRFAPGAVSYRWRADVQGFAMPVKVGTAGRWQVIRPTAAWQTMKSPLGSDDFQVATDLYFVNVTKLPTGTTD